MSMIFLIGFMGSGKTAVGKRLAELLSFEFIDLDDAIEKSEGKSIAQIFQEHGEEYFRRKESFSLQSLSAKTNTVIATGGGTPCFHDNMQWMLANGITIYLNTDSEVLFHRLKPEMAHRPLLRQNSEEELKNFIATKLKERELFYLYSKLIVDTGAFSIDQLAQRIYSLLV